MRYALTVFSFLLFGALASPTAANTIDLEPSSDWRLREYDDKCRISRSFGSDEDQVTMWLDQGGSKPIYNLTLIGRPFRNPYGPAVRIQMGDEPEFFRSYISVKSSKGRPVLSMFGLTMIQPELEREEDAEAPGITLDEDSLGAIRSLRIRNSIPNPVKLNLGEMTEQLGFLQECGQRLEVLLSEAGRPLSTEARPPKPLNYEEWLKDSDYPDYLVRAEMEGAVDYRLTVGKSGAATGCFIIGSNKPQLFDDAICLGLMKRAKFEPAKDALGKSVASYFLGRVTFRKR